LAGKKTKREEVAISFHYLERYKANAQDEYERVPFSAAEFGDVIVAFEKLKGVDITEVDAELKEQLKFKNVVPIEEIEEIDARTYCGIYKGIYWGHSYENSDHGEISADSLNLRPFFFLLYLSESGKIYIGTQYLGSYGSYWALKNTVLSALKERGSIIAKSFNFNPFSLKDVVAKEVEIKFSKKSDSLTAGSTFGKVGAVVLTGSSKDSEFTKRVSENFLSHAEKSQDEIKKAVAESLHNNNMLLEINDDDIDGCNVMIIVNKKTKTIRLLEEASYASKVPLDVARNPGGHPQYEPVKKEALSLFNDKILAICEDQDV
jgi:hypothetical protein